MVVKENVSIRYLRDGEVEAHIDDDSEEEDVECSHHQQRLLQHEDLIEVVMHLRRGEQQAEYSCHDRHNTALHIHCTTHPLHYTSTALHILSAPH